MKRFITLLFVVTGFFVSGNSLSDVQDANVEEWTGSLKRTDKRPEKVTFEVNKSEESLLFKAIKYSGKKFEFRDHKIRGDSLTFIWTPGDLDANCHLKKQEDGRYVGKCHYTDSDKSLELSLIPPQVEETQAEETQTEELQTAESQAEE
jgi:hypothetical protein